MRARMRTAAVVSLLALVVPAAGAQDAATSQIVAKQVGGALPLDPLNPLWEGAAAQEVMLAPQNRAQPQIFEAQVSRASVKALHNGSELALRVEWEDKTLDSSVLADRYTDAAAVMFPAASATKKRLAQAITMGTKENPVHIWFWKASWQMPVEREKSYGSSDEFDGAALSENSVSAPREGAAESLVAEGFGTATDYGGPQPRIRARGAWKEGRWAVVFSGPLNAGDKHEVDFKAQPDTPIAFALWNGAEAQRGARKVYSPAWYRVVLE